jgi:hypothetical protein
MITSKIKFPEFTGIKCNMMPFIQGDSSSLPSEYRSYSEIIKENYIEKGQIGYLTIHESFVQGGKSQRGYNSSGIKRNVHVEVGRRNDVNFWGGGGGGWGGRLDTILADETKVLISNSVSDTCRVWNVEDRSYTKDGDLSQYIDKYPEETGTLLKSGELAKISIFTPHECISQLQDSNRQFFRIVGVGVKGRESYFTINPLMRN